MSTRLAIVFAVLACALLVGCTGEKAPEPPAAASPTPLAQVDLSGIIPVRAPFCSVVPEASLELVLGGAPESATSYASGDRAELVRGLTDVAAEFNCTFTRKNRIARAWILDRPLTGAVARTLIEERRSTAGCRPAGELAFGSPGLVQSCPTGARREVRLAGLFGDSWVTCQSMAPQGSPAFGQIRRTQQWCVELLTATGLP